MKPESVLIQLQSWAQEECVAQSSLLTALEEMESAVRTADDARLERLCGDLEAVLATGQPRAARRTRLTGALAAHFAVAPETLSLGSILERARASQLAGEATLEGLARLRKELLARVRDVSLRARRMSAVAAHQRGLLNDLLTVLAGGGRVAPGAALGSPADGNLVNAEA